MALKYFTVKVNIKAFFLFHIHFLEHHIDLNAFEIQLLLIALISYEVLDCKKYLKKL